MSRNETCTCTCICNIIMFVHYYKRYPSRGLIKVVSLCVYVYTVLCVLLLATARFWQKLIQRLPRHNHLLGKYHIFLVQYIYMYKHVHVHVDHCLFYKVNGNSYSVLIEVWYNRYETLVPYYYYRMLTASIAYKDVQIMSMQMD